MWDEIRLLNKFFFTTSSKIDVQLGLRSRYIIVGCLIKFKHDCAIFEFSRVKQIFREKVSHGPENED